ncbi:hypothetical protein RYZ26_01030 [Terasakiella sp. A23]|uniref:hypothetical protein n=1 Tax=Terasakiella sp. FCG-A23 TaxID=3080561 RepID=UPI002955C05E|nr:hypothetical protein [Terasakiella sp. A23]MDV7338158.1 hypothetical protein [Terasakiella sp. A23]
MELTEIVIGFLISLTAGFITGWKAKEKSIKIKQTKGTNQQAGENNTQNNFNMTMPRDKD